MITSATPSAMGPLMASNWRRSWFWIETLPVTRLLPKVRPMLPPGILERPKQGFGVPVHEWFFGKLGEQAREKLEWFCRETPFLDRNEVFRLIDAGNGPQVWYLLNFALWWQTYVRA